MSKPRNKDILNSLTVETTPINFLPSFIIDNDIISVDEARKHIKDNRISLEEDKIRKQCHHYKYYGKNIELC